MAITVDEIRNKEFTEVSKGYDPDEVDDFLDELANQTEELAHTCQQMERSAKAAQEEIARLKADLDAAQTALAKAQEQAKNVPAVQEEAGKPSFNEPSYFKNLETTLRETLISAQRIADETIDDARKKARRIVSDAEEQAAALESQSAQKLSEMRSDYEQLKSKGEEYHRNFSKLVEEQARLLKESPLYAVAESDEE